MEGPYLVGIDAGTSAVKTGVFTTDGRILALGRRDVPIETPHSGWAEQDMHAVWRDVRDTIREALAAAEIPPVEIVGVGLAGQGDGCRLLDEHLAPVRPSILWIDGRAGDIVARWQHEGLNDEAFGYCGSAVFSGTAMAILRWLEQYEPETLNRSRHFLFAKDWIQLKLTGTLSTDESDASRGPIDLHRRCYSEELFQLFGITRYRSMFPPILPSARVAGQVSRAAAEETGLVEGTPVIAGMIDVAAMPVALGVVEHGQAYAIVGTTCFNAALGEAPLPPTHPEGMSIAYPRPRHVIQSMPSLAGTTNLDWFSRECCNAEQREAERTGTALHQCLESQAAKVSVGAGGVLYHPYINPGGERAPFVKPTARAQFFGLSLDHSRAHLLRAVYEGVALSMRDCFQDLPVDIEEIRLAGGGAASRLWCQIFADVTGVPVSTFHGRELGALGGAMVAGVAVQQFPDLPHAAEKAVHRAEKYEPRARFHQQYGELFELYRRIRQHLWEDWDLRDRILHHFSQVASS